MLDMEMQFCALKYRPPDASMAAGGGTVVLLVVNDEPGLRFYVHPKLDEQISECDRNYLENLIPDLLIRAKDAPEDVFQQLCQLCVGPLEAEEVDQIHASEKAIQELYPELQRIS
jgi:hypothetical protein